MDFHSLSRRELQALCKKNKIPANLTNVAMADALAALEMVEGIEEIINPSQSSTELDLASPYVPPTGGRSTRRRAIAKEEPETVNPTTRTRRTTARTNLVKDTDESQADAINTPLVAQPSRTRGRMASACRKMDSALKECVDEEKKDVSMTPAPVGATSRRRRVAEASVTKVYSTRRSVRLVEKNEVEKEESEVPKKELLGQNEVVDLEEKNVDIPNEVDSEEMDLKESPEDTNELSGITVSGADGITGMDEGEKFDDNTFGVNIVLPLIVSNKVKQNDVEKTEEQNTEKDAESQAADIPIIETAVENAEEQNSEKDAKSQEEVDDFVENVVFETKVDEMSEISSYNGSDDEVEKDEVTEDNPEFDSTLAKFIDLGLHKATEEEVSHGQLLADEAAEADSDFIDKDEPVELHKVEPAETEALQLEESEKGTDLVPSDDAEFIDNLANPVEINKDEPVKSEESEKAIDLVPSDDAEEVHFHPASLHVNANFADQIPSFGVVDEKPSHLNHVFTPSKHHSASKAHFAVKRVTDFSDNKENIGSGTKLVVMQDRVKVTKKNNTVEDVDDLADLSVRQLTKMLKQKLEITNKSSKNEQAKEATSRPALQALPENQLVD